MNKKNQLYLVDVSSMFFRAYYAIRHLSNDDGLPTNAIYGFLSMVVKLLKEENPSHLAFCYDRPDPSFRKEIYPEYKANRSEMPEDLAPQIPYIKKLTSALGIPSFEKKSYEADDLIGTLARFGEANKLDVTIISGDKDFAQLINSRIHMFDTMKNTRFDVDKVIEKWGVHPDQFIDYLALTGDSSDNIPGVRGVGPKGAQKLIAEFKTVEAIYEGIETIKNPNMQKKLMDSKDNAILSKELVTIKTDIDLGLSSDDLRCRPIERDELNSLLDELGFHSFKKNLLGETQDDEGEKTAKDKPKSSSKSKEASEDVYKPLEYSGRSFARWFKKLDSLWVLESEKEFLFANGDYVVRFTGTPDELSTLMNGHSIHWLGYDVKSFFRRVGFNKTAKIQWDVQLAAYLMSAGAVKSFRDVYQKYLGKDLPEFANGKQLYEAHLETKEMLLGKLKEAKMGVILETMDFPLVDLLVAMESSGIRLDVDFLANESKELEKDIENLETSIHGLADEKFNVASPKQLSAILFEKLDLPKGKKTKTGYSTDTSVLEKLKDVHPIAELILEFRELTKLKSTYVDALPQLVDKETGRLHTQFNQALTTTGRLSSVNPNLQNIPIKTERGLRVRQAFVPKEGSVLVSADYSQIELRVLAHISGDKGLVEAFSQGEDIHTRAACEIFSVAEQDVTSDLRRKAKAVNFGIAYGQGVYGLAETLAIPRGEAKEIIETYFERFSGVKEYMESMAEKVKDQGYVETLFGRRRYLPEIESSRANIRAFAERAAINAPIQGTASDLVKMAMLQLGEKYREQMLLQVHDEMIFELPDDANLETAMKDITQIMETCVELDVPLKVNIESGGNWAEIH